MTRHISPTLLLLCCAAAGWTQQEKPYDLPAVMRTALANHPSLRAAMAQVSLSRSQLSGAKAGYAPKVSATLSYSELQEQPSFAIAGFGTMIYGRKDNKQASLNLQMPLWTGGKLEGFNEQALWVLRASECALHRQQEKVVMDAALAYFNVLKARAMVKVMEDQMKSLEAHRDAIAKMVDRGVATRIDQLRAETAVSAAQEGRIRAGNAVSVAIAGLANAMGLSGQSHLTVVETPETPTTELPDNIATAFEEALQARLEVRQTMAALNAAKAGERVARSNRRPQLGLFAQYDFERPTYLPETGNWSAGIAFTKNLFDGGATRAEIARVRAEVAQADAMLTEIRNAISLQVTQAFLKTESAKERITATEKASATATEGLRLTTLGYQNGVNTITDLLAAQAELTKALTDCVLARYDLQVAQAELRYALGRQP